MTLTFTQDVVFEERGTFFSWERRISIARVTSMFFSADLSDQKEDCPSAAEDPELYLFMDQN